MPESAMLIAKHIIVKSESQSKPVSNLKLQKLLYYVQGWALGLYDNPAFADNIQAWVHGPVVPSVFFAFRDFKWNPITFSGALPDLSTELNDHIDSVLCAYGDLTAAQLERLSHEESPWRVARGALPPTEPSTAVISHDLMREYFRGLANESDETEHSATCPAAG